MRKFLELTRRIAPAIIALGSFLFAVIETVDKAELFLKTVSAI